MGMRELPVGESVLIRRYLFRATRHFRQIHYGYILLQGKILVLYLSMRRGGKSRQKVFNEYKQI